MNELFQSWIPVMLMVLLVITALYVIGYFGFTARPREKELRESINKRK